MVWNLLYWRTIGALHVLIANRSSVWTAEAGVAPANAQQLNLRSDIYNASQNIEDLIPISQETEVVGMGTFNATAGEFSRKTSRQEVASIGGKPHIVTTPASETIDAVNVQLRFTFQSRGLGLLHVITNGVRTRLIY